MRNESSTHLVHRTKDQDYEFIGFFYSAKELGIHFQSTEKDDSVRVGETRYIFGRQYYCLNHSLCRENSRAYWAAIDKTVTADVVYKELIKEIDKTIAADVVYEELIKEIKETGPHEI